MVITTSTPSAASAALPTASMPSATAASIAACTTSKPFTLWPALSRLTAMGPPMLPSPMNPMSVMPPSPVSQHHRQRMPRGTRAVQPGHPGSQLKKDEELCQRNAAVTRSMLTVSPSSESGMMMSSVRLNSLFLPT